MVSTGYLDECEHTRNCLDEDVSLDRSKLKNLLSVIRCSKSFC